jgi:hypothetical protein
MKTRLPLRLPVLALAVLCALLVGGVEAADNKIEGTWNVALTFGRCDATCPCPPGVTTATPISTLNTFLRDGAFLWVGNSFLVSPGQGSWKRIPHGNAQALYTFFLFNPNGSQLGSEEVTKDIHLTGPDTFEATGAFDLFIGGVRISPTAGCPFSETGTRFE